MESAVSKFRLFLASPTAAAIILAATGAVGAYHVLKNKRKPARDIRSNPSSNHKSVSEAARAFFKDFHWGNESKRSYKARIKPLKEGTELGEVVSIQYRTAKDGKAKHIYEHEFGETGKKRPRLVADAKNKSLHFVGGGYTVTDKGIEG